MGAAEEDPVEAGDEIECPECRTTQPAGATFCSHCGARIPSGGAAGGRRRRRRAQGDALEKSHARHEFGRLKGSVYAVRSLFWVTAGLSLLIVILLHLGLAAADAPFEPMVVGILVLLWGETIAKFAGAILVMRAPLVWTALAAGWASLNLVLILATGGGFSIGTVVQTLVVTGLWAGVGQAARIQKLMAADPSLRLVRRRLAPEERVQGGVADRAGDRRRAQRRAATKRLLLLGGATVLMIVGLAFAYAAWTAPPKIEKAVAEFVGCWRNTEVDRLSAWFVDGPADRGAMQLREELERRGWRALPAIGEAKIESVGGTAEVTFPAGSGELRVAFLLADNRWRLRGLRLPEFIPPPLTPAIDQFRRAWGAAGTEALVAMVRESSRERLGGSIRRVLEGRQWHERRPALGDVDPGREDRVRRRVMFTVEGEPGDLEVAFEFWAPGWRVVGIRLPRE